MECKDHIQVLLYEGFIVLIETLWNVKRFIKDLCNGIDTVLIETLWNVKIDSAISVCVFPEY